jgi:uncharacterized membrane protein YbaN (DUF454 family)
MSEKLEAAEPSTSRFGRGLFLAAGCAFVALAILGVFLPLLPATPFALLASGCFVRSSPRLARWLLRSPLLGPLLRDWQQRRGVTLKVKITAVLVVLAGLAATLLAADLPLAARVTAVALGGIGLAVVVRLPTLR